MIQMKNFTKKLVEDSFLDYQIVQSGQMLLNEHEDYRDELKRKMINIDWKEKNKSLFERNDKKVRLININ